MTTDSKEDGTDARTEPVVASQSNEFLFSHSVRRTARLVLPDSLDYPMGIIVVVAGAFVYVNKLGVHPMAVWDPPLYANVARHAAELGYWLIPHVSFNNHAAGPVGLQPFLFKPPLGYWLQALSMLAFGTTKFAARLPAAVATVLTGGLVYLVGREMYDRYAGIVATVVLFTTPQIFHFEHGGRSAALDLPFTFFGTLFVCLVWVAVQRDRPRWFVPAGVAAGLAVLVKGPAAGVFVLALAPLVLVRWRAFLGRSALLGAVATLLLVLPWPLAVWLIRGEAFLERMLVEQVLNRVLGSYGVSYDATYGFMQYPYFRQLPTFFDPWLLFFLSALLVVPVANLARKERNELPETLFLIWWALSIFGFFVFTGNHSWYIIPAYIPAAMLVGRLLGGAARGRSVELAGTLVGVALVVVLSGRLAPILPDVVPRYDVVYYLEGVKFLVAFFVGVASIVLWSPVSSAARERLVADDYRVARFVVPVVVALVVVSWMAPPGLFGVYGYEYSVNQERIGERIDASAPPDETVYIHSAIQSEPFYVIAFFAERPLATASADELAAAERIEYAVVGSGALADVDREYTVLGNLTHHSYENATVVRFE